ncbi:phospholipase A2 inhibitor and Ly6/PLAUR domain-containing protein-like isoform X2 [Betta splendens]|uniref:Phospholipase A2 inhibitor and Ly6/PLAUR domain-containing protein-like isoform X2 n=1 Tax=Betta splendens TaxID=158456 RepID=A0A6P7M5U7_BETSP|nr:phospholipase A2 inhibitor and Ly6/PLAUR domain-containing protein-like isoform X2 [Betta splendens]
MQAILSLILVWTHFSTAGSLQCETCTDQRCSATALVSCSSASMCVTASVLAKWSGGSSEHIFKACAPRSLCPASGPHTFSASTKDASTFASALCCNTDGCNSGTLPLRAAPSDNGLKCLPADPSWFRAPVQCKGVERSCFQARGEAESYV